jgi:hypothetical protein
MAHLIAFKVVEERNSRLSLGSNSELHQVLQHMLQPFLAGYFHACVVLAEVTILTWEKGIF